MSGDFFMCFSASLHEAPPVPQVRDVHSFYTHEVLALVSNCNQIVLWERGDDPECFQCFGDVAQAGTKLDAWLLAHNFRVDGLKWHEVDEGTGFDDAVKVVLDVRY